MVIDSERATRRLVAVGVDEDMATAIADIVADATEGLATKEDLAEVKADIARLEARMFRSFWFQTLAIIGAVAALQTVFTTIIIATIG